MERLPVIYELPRELFARASPLFAEAWMDGAFIWGPFEGHLPGRLFVDDAARPTAALLYRPFEYYVAGDPGAAELRSFIADAPAEVMIFERLYGYVATNVPLAHTLLADHAGRLGVVARRCFRWAGDQAAQAALAQWRTPVAGFTSQQIDQTLAERFDRELGTMMGPFWSGRDNFLAHGFGFCALAGDELASIAYAAAVGGGEANIAVLTAPAFRRHGLAARVCTTFIDYCQGHDFVATWDCDSNNAASAALARSLGFREGIPFAQLSTPGYVKLTESHGRWARGEATAEGITPWRQVAG
jgi:RimJ/RimL family protein N-acetyltransferase